jgi:hypothetical protein
MGSFGRHRRHAAVQHCTLRAATVICGMTEDEIAEMKLKESLLRAMRRNGGQAWRHDQELRRGGRAGEARPGRVLRRLWAAGSTSASRCSLFVSAKRSPVTVFAYRKELALFEISFRSRDEPGAQLPFWIFCSLGQPQQGWRLFDARVQQSAGLLPHTEPGFKPTLTNSFWQ